MLLGSTSSLGGLTVEAAYAKPLIVVKRAVFSSSLLGLAVYDLGLILAYEYTDKCMSSHGRQFDPGRGHLLLIFFYFLQEHDRRFYFAP
jgi:hypothetical protein